MMHSKTNSFMGTNKSVYRDSPTGKLETSLIRIMLSLQKGFDGNSQTGFSVAIDKLTAFLAFEHGIVSGRMTFPNSTAVGTPFAGMPAIHNVQNYIIIEASLLQNELELIKRDSHYGSIEPLALDIELPKLLNGNVCIESLCDFDNFSDDLTEIGLDIISFGMFEPSEFLGGIEGLEQGSPSHELLASCQDMLSKICLIQDFALGIDNRNSEVLCVDVNTEHITIIVNDFFVIGKISDNISIGEQAVCLASPSIGDKGTVSLKVAVASDWNCNCLARDNPKPDEEIGFGIECFAVSWNIELDADGFDGIGIFPPSITNNGTDNLNIERGVFLAV